MSSSARTGSGGERFSSLNIEDPGLSSALGSGLREVEALLRELLRSEVALISETSHHLFEAGGKRFRPLFTLLAAQFGRGINEDVVKAAAAVELVHLASLYHDDVMDEASMRRGAPSANARWDNSIAILTGDFLFARASYLVADLGVEAARIIASTFGELVTGQMRESTGPAAGADRVSHYLTVIAEKTGSLIATSGQYGGMLSGAAEAEVRALRRLGELVGSMFQISDDVIDIDSPATESGKTPGTDLREGVLTLPMLYALGDENGQGRLTELLRGPLTDDRQVAEALELLRASDGLRKARETLADYARQARAQLDTLPKGAANDALGDLIDYMQARTT
ncbi:polyprenyl synthetase family protein [Actinoalloteichus caeruleus]|uniref:polyprenyl synthetase family protein n=1 Tax=Actinoalloteichus TaxID=65496 RepID=UPI0004AA90F7